MGLIAVRNGLFATQTLADDSMVEANLLIIRRMAEVLQNPNICGQKSCRSECCVKSDLINVKCDGVINSFPYTVIFKV